MRPRWRKVAADLWSNKIRSLLVIASIAVGLFSIGIISSINAIITQDMRDGYMAVSPANIQFQIVGFNNSLLDIVREMPEVQSAEGVRIISLRYRNVYGQWDRVQIQAIPDFNRMDINQVEIMEGNWPPDYRQIAVDNHRSEDIPAKLGEEIEVELPSGKIRRLTLSGVVHDQTIGSSGGGGGYFMAPLQGYVSLHTLDWLEEPAVYNMLYVTVKDGNLNEQQIRDTASKINQQIENHGLIVLSTNIRTSDAHPNAIYVNAVSGVLFLLGLLVVFLSGFLITNTLSALLNQQTRQIGVMKTIGARRKQIIGVYMVLIFLYGVLAFIIALPASSRAAYALSSFLSAQLNFNVQGFRQVPRTIIIEAIIALLVPQVAGFVPILNGANTKTHDALSGGKAALQESASGWIDRRANQFKRLSRPMLISLRNTFRRKTRLALTLFTLTLGGAIFIATFNVQQALGLYIRQISRYFVADVSMTMDQNYRISSVRRDLSGFDWIDNIEGWSYARCEVLLDGSKAGEAVDMLGVPPDSKQITPILIKGRWIIPGDQNAIALNELFLSAYPDLDVGDTIRLRVNGSQSDWVVVGFFQLAGKSAGYRAYVNYDYLSRWIGQPEKAISFQIKARGSSLTIQQQRELGRQVENHMRDLGYNISNTSAGLFALEASTAGIGTLTSFLVFMSILTALVGAIGLMGTMSMNVIDRTREIGIMRAIGASDRTVMTLVITEGGLIGVISWILGSLAAFPISSALSNSISESLFGAPSILAYTPTGFVVWLGLVMLLAFVASYIPARNAARLTIREVLAYE